MTKTFHLNYNIPAEFCTINVSGFWKLPLIILVKMLSRVFFKNVVPTESFSVASDADPINIFKEDYSNLKHLNKRHETAR